MSRKPHGIEVVIMLGDTCVEHAVVEPGGRIGELSVVETATGCGLHTPEGAEVATPLRLPCGLGTMTLSPIARSTVALAKRPVDRWMRGVLAASLVAHLAVLGVALHRSAPHKPEPRSQGASRPRLVATHTMATRARRDLDVVRSTSAIDQPELSPDLAPAPVTAGAAEARRAITQVRRAELRAPAARDGIGKVNQPATEAARHFDPCDHGDCGLIATSRYETATTGQHAGDEYQLPQRDVRSLETAVVACDADGNCNTTSGNDQSDVRTAIAHHLAEINACFEGHPDEASAAIDARVDGDGTVRVWAHDPNPVSTCIAAVAAKLTFASGERNVTLAFARDH